MQVRIQDCRLALVLAAGFLTGCGGSGGGGSAAPGPSPAAARGTTAVTVRIDVPLSGAASTRRPAYVSPATQSLAIAVETSGGQIVGTFSVNITTASTACQTVTVNGIATLTCSLSVPLALPASGTYTLATATFDQPQTQPCSPAGTPRCAGSVLSAALISASLQLNAANVVSIALGGLANGFTVTPVANGFIQGNVSGLHIWGPLAQTLIVQALDADGYTIVGSGAPTIAVSAASPSVQVTAAAPGTFSIAATVSGGVVTPGTIPLMLVATPVGSPAQPFSDTVALTISHTAVFVSATNNVFVFLDGGTTSSITLATTNSPRGVAVDTNGNVYVANHGNSTITECLPAGTYATCNVLALIGINGPEGVATDAAGNVWVADSSTPSIDEYLAGQMWGLPVVRIRWALPKLRGVGFDTSGNLWASDQMNSVVLGYAPPLMDASPSTVTLSAGISSPIQISTDGSGDLWVADLGTNTVVQFAPPITSPSTPSTTLNAGLNGPQGVAVDATGTVWIASNGNGMVLRCSPPAGTVACTSFPVANALWMAVYPASFNQ